MVRACICCKQKNNKSGERISLYGFPKDITLKELWLNAIGIETKVCESARVCSRHFKQEDFRYSIVGEKPFLKQGAVPSLYLDGQFEKNLQYEHSLGTIQGLPETATDIYTEASIDIPQEVILTITNITTTNSKSESCSDPLNVRFAGLPELSVPVARINVNTASETYLKHQRSIDDVRWEEISTSPTQAKIYWEVAVGKIQRQRVLIKTLKQKVKRLRKKVTDLRNTVKNLAGQSAIHIVGS